VHRDLLVRAVIEDLDHVKSPFVNVFASPLAASTATT
jgi:hypothetical protein